MACKPGATSSELLLYMSEKIPVTAMKITFCKLSIVFNTQIKIVVGSYQIQ